MKRFFNILIGTCLCFTAIVAQDDSGDTSKWKIDDVIMSENAGQFDISPDGKLAVWVKNTADKEKDRRVSNVILSSLTEKREIELTRGSEWNNTNPKWSPNGQLIAFVSTRPLPKGGGTPQADAGSPGAEGPRPQIWLFNALGGEPWNLTSFVRGITNYEWMDDDTIIFIAPEEPTNYEKTLKEKKDGSVVVEDEENTPPVRLFKVSVKSKKIIRLSENNDWIRSFALSSDCSKVFAIHNRSLSYVYDQKVKPVAVLHDLKTGESRELFKDRKINLVSVQAAREADGFYVVTAYTTHPQYVNAAIDLVNYYDPATGNLKNVPLDWENALGGSIEVTNNGFIAPLAGGVRHKWAHYINDGSNWKRMWIEGDHLSNTFNITMCKDGRTLVYSHTTPSTPVQWHKATLEGTRLKDSMQVTFINKHFDKRVKARSEIVRWKGALDEEIEGVLLYPHNYEAGKKYPLMLMIHGGPHGADMDAWRETYTNPTNIICERGAFVLKPNYHGSSNYGLKFGESISGGKYYDLEVPDIEKGVDYLISRGLVDPDRLGTMGWSNGSILSIALAVSNPRYKVLGAGAGDVDWTSDWGNAHFGAAFDNYYFGKSPLEDPKLYIEKSPFYRLDRVVAPTIIFFGTVDTNVPTQQGWLHYRAMQQIGKTPVRFVLFPGEPHGLQKLSHQRRKMEEELAWFDTHFFKTLKDENKAVRENSPLALAIKGAGFSKSGNLYGSIKNGKLVPETVKHGKLELGRFEVTRAQYAAFDPSYKFEEGTGNHPANNITFDKARAYCDWLSRLTGSTYRLANADEIKAVYDSAKSGENTLDYWAGYSPNPDDAALLQKKLQELGDGAPLVKPVGSFKATGDDPVYDLGGNVAEWAVGKDGKGVVLGGSADQPSDEKNTKRSPSPAYTGFRVVK